VSGHRFGVEKGRAPRVMGVGLGIWRFLSPLLF
jgi:hypothetical protein